MTVPPPIDPNKDATYQITLGSTFDDTPRQSFHALKYNFKPAAIDYNQPGNLTHSEDAQGEVSLALPSTTDGEHHIFKGPIQEAKANEFVLVYDPETGSFVLERLSSMSRLSATRSSRTNTLNGNTNIFTPIPMRPRSKSDDDIPTISLDAPAAPSSSRQDALILDDPEDPIVPTLVTPRLPPVSPKPSRPRNKHPEPESSDDYDDDSDISLQVPRQPFLPAVEDPDDDVSDEDLDDLANELESSLENRPESSSEEVDSDIPGPPPRNKGPDFGNVPRSGGPISMSRFAGGRRREEEESSSSDDDDDD